MANHADQDISNCLARARIAGDSERFELLEKYRNYLTFLARARTDRRLSSKVSDSDIVQETLIQAHRDFFQFRGQTEAELTSWLRAIMSNKKALLARRFYGSPARDPRLEVRFQDEFDRSSQMLGRVFVDNRSTPSEHHAKRERAVLLADALAALPEHYREVVELRHIEGLKMREVAYAMGRSVDSVNKLWARAMIQLRSSMKEGD